MAPPPMKEPDLALAGVALLVMFGLLMWHDSPIKSSHPLDPYVQHQDPPITGYGYESWLWQDPFGFDLDSYLQRDQYLIEFDGNAEEASHRRYWVHKKIDLIDQKMHPTPTASNKKGVHKKTGRETSDKSQCEYQLEEEIKRIKRIKNDVKNHVTILAPLLKVRPNTLENKELRTRHRYAVIAGLIELGYHPSEPDLLHFCSVQKNSSKKEYDVRWERFYDESKDKPDIIVVWMNSEIFTNTDKFTDVSENLPKIISENEVRIYDLNNILDQKRSAWITEKINRINDENCKNKGIELKGTQTDDKALTENLTEELKQRNILGSSEVRIITEQDSENARNLASTFCQAFCKDKRPVACEISGIK